jgi:hypothetical protein
MYFLLFFLSLFYDTLCCRLFSVSGIMTDIKRKGKDLEDSGYGLIKALPQKSSGGNRENQKILGQYSQCPSRILKGAHTEYKRRDRCRATNLRRFRLIDTVSIITSLYTNELICYCVY